MSPFFPMILFDLPQYPGELGEMSKPRNVVVEDRKIY